MKAAIFRQTTNNKYGKRIKCLEFFHSDIFHVVPEPQLKYVAFVDCANIDSNNKLYLKFFIVVHVGRDLQCNIFA